MRLIQVIPILIVLVYSCASTDCKLDPYHTSNNQRIVKGEVRKPLVTQNKQDTGFVHITFSYYNELDSSFKDSINHFISSSTQMMTEFEGEDEVQSLSNKYFSDQADSFIVIYKEEQALDDYDPIWDMEFGFDIDDHYSSFAELTFSGWSYTGGAHGNGFYTVHMFDKSTGILLDLDDFFKDVERLNSIAEHYFRKLQGLTGEDDLGEAGFWFDNNEFAVNNNFYFSGKSLVFYFNTYEIAPYAGGPTELEIPIEEIKHLLLREI